MFIDVFTLHAFPPFLYYVSPNNLQFAFFFLNFVLLLLSYRLVLFSGSVKEQVNKGNLRISTMTNLLLENAHLC